MIGRDKVRVREFCTDRTDVAEATATILSDPGTVGRTYELAGLGAYALRELIEMTLRFTGKWRLIVPVPFALAEMQAWLLELLPNPPLTTVQIDLLNGDNVASGALPGLRELNIEPKTVEEVVPTHIGLRVPRSR